MTDTERYYSLQSLFINNPHSMNEKALKEYRGLIDIHDKDPLRAKEHKERIKFILQVKEHQKREKAKHDEMISQASKRYQELKSEWSEKGITQNPDGLAFYKDGKEIYYPKTCQVLTIVREMEEIYNGLGHRVKEYIITGISEDGTMHDGVYRPWINQPKKEQKMTREEAIELVNSTTKFWGNGETAFGEALERLKQPITLAEILVWEEGQEYEWRGDIFRIQSDILQVWDKDDESWYDSVDELNDYLRLRQAKKVEPRLKAWYVRDEYSFNELQKELESKGIHKYKGQEYLPDDFFKNNSSIYVFVENETWHTSSWYNVPEGRHIIAYHKEEPKYYAMIKLPEKVKTPPYLSFEYGEKESGVFKLKGWVELNKIDAITKSEWLEYGITDDNADFELREVKSC